MDKEKWLRLRILIGLLVVLVAILLFYTIPALSWEEITIYDEWSSGSDPEVIPYSKYDSETGRTSDGYIYDYRSQPYQPSPAERELERQELRREDWWRNDYKDWLEDQGVDRGLMMGW